MTKIKNNLHIDGNKVISYTTHVATIQDDKLIVLGKWSNTTSRHISHVANMFNLKVVNSEDFKNYSNTISHEYLK